MTPSPENSSAKLERVLHTALREVPNRRAPESLEQRVLAEIARRAALPWWKRSYVHWPLPARCAFLLGSGLVLNVVILAAVWMLAGFETKLFAEAFLPTFGRIAGLVDLGNSIVEFISAVLSTVPRFWLYAGGVCLAAMYATLFGLGAFAYRVLHPRRPSF